MKINNGATKQATANFMRQCREAEADARSRPGYAAVAYVSVPVSREFAERVLAEPWRLRVTLDGDARVQPAVASWSGVSCTCAPSEELIREIGDEELGRVN
jgi:hypothetical protein